MFYSTVTLKMWFKNDILISIDGIIKIYSDIT